MHGVMGWAQAGTQPCCTTVSTSRPAPQTLPNPAVQACRRTLSWSVSVIQRELPRVLVMSARRGGLQKASQRRGVTPLVLFWNFSGKMS